MSYTRQQIADALDLAVLKPTATMANIVSAADMVETENIRSVCVAPAHIRLARVFTKRIAAVIGFPHGNTLFTVKLLEANAAVRLGATELDVVVNYGHFLDGKPQTVAKELTVLVNLFRPLSIVIKAILETCYYTPAQIRDACKLCVDCSVDFVKTSTGFGPAGATAEAVKIMVDAVRHSNVQVKASGGIKTYADAARYLDLGCTRLGASVYKELLP